MNQNNRVTAKYNHEFTYLDNNYQVHITSYENDYLSNESVGGMKTQVIILENGNRKKELALPEQVELLSEAEKVFADVEKQIDKILK